MSKPEIIVVSPNTKYRETVHAQVGSMPLPLGEEEHTGYTAGITENEAKEHPVHIADNPSNISGNDTAAHILANAFNRVSHRQRDLKAGAKMEAISSTPTLALAGIAQGDATAIYVALGASAEILSMIGYRVFQSHKTLQHLQKQHITTSAIEKDPIVVTPLQKHHPLLKP